MSMSQVIKSIEREAFDYATKTAEDDLEAKIIEYTGKIADILKNGNSVEIHPTKGGLKVFEVRKKVAK